MLQNLRTPDAKCSHFDNGISCDRLESFISQNEGFRGNRPIFYSASDTKLVVSIMQR